MSPNKCVYDKEYFYSLGALLEVINQHHDANDVEAIKTVTTDDAYVMNEN